jgi:hypothetical protein
MNKAHRQSEDRYETTRIDAREAAMSALPLVMPNRRGQAINLKREVSLTGIDFRASVRAQAWESSPNRLPDVTLSWPGIAAKYARTAPKRFELAVWFRDSLLCGLSLGQPTWSGQKLRLDLIEASPDKTPLSGVVADITIIAAKVYADLIGATQLRIMHPVNEKVKAHYLGSTMGFSYDVAIFATGIFDMTTEKVHLHQWALKSVGNGRLNVLSKAGTQL